MPDRVPHPLDVLAEHDAHDAIARADRVVDDLLTDRSVALDIRGEAGDGASHLVHRIVERARAEGIAVVARPFSAGLQRTELEDLASAIGKLAGVWDEHTGWRGLPEPKQVAWIEDSISRAVREHGRVLLAFDDLHLATKEVQKLAYRVSTWRYGVGAHGIVATGPPADLRPQVGPERPYVLRPLTRDQIATVAREVLGAVDTSTLEALVARSEGNAYWLRDLLLEVVDAPPEDHVALIRTFDKEGFGRFVLNGLGERDALALEALAVIADVGPVSSDDLARITEIDDIAETEHRIGAFTRKDGGRLNVHHDIIRRAVLGEIGMGRQVALRRRAIETLDDPALIAAHVVRLPAGAIDDDVRLLAAGAEHAPDIDTRQHLLREALARAKGDLKRAQPIARELARVQLDDGKPDGASRATATLRRFEPKPLVDADGYADWVLLQARADRRLATTSAADVTVELGRAWEALSYATSPAGTRLAVALAGRRHLDPFLRSKLSTALQGLAADPGASVAVLVAAAEQAASDGGPAHDARAQLSRARAALDGCVPDALRAELDEHTASLLEQVPAAAGGWQATVVELLHRALERVVFDDASPDGLERAVRVQRLLVGCGELEQLATEVEPAVLELLAGRDAELLAEHHALQGRRLLLGGRLDEAIALLKADRPEATQDVQDIGRALLADAYVERGRLDTADHVLGPPPVEVEDRPGAWRLHVVRARVDRHLLRASESIERLAKVGAVCHGHLRGPDSVPWRVDLTRVLHRYRFPDHPESPAWQAHLPPLGLRRVPPDQVLERLVEQELKMALTWGGPVSLARALRISAEVLPDAPSARAYRYLAVALLGTPDGSCPGPAELEYVVACEDLARQRVADLDGAADPRAERREIGELCGHALQLAERRRAVLAWLRIWDVTAEARIARRAYADRPIPFLSPVRQARAEVGAVLSVEAVRKLFDCSEAVVTEDRRRISAALKAFAPNPKVLRYKPVEARWRLYRRLRHEAVEAMFADRRREDLSSQDASI